MKKSAINSFINRSGKTVLRFLAAGALVLAIFLMIPSGKASAKELSVAEVNYFTDELTLETTAGDTAAWVSDNKGSAWEQIPGSFDGGELVVDISWAASTSKKALWFRGDKSTDIVKMEIPKQYTKFKASYKKATGTVLFSGDDGRTIEWRKKESTKWQTVNRASFENVLRPLFTKGATLVFRLAPVNGTSAAAPGLRASKEVTVTIPKKSEAPNVSIDDAKLAISVKKGMAYRYVNADGSTTEWTDITRTYAMPLAEIAPASIRPGETTITCVQFRTNATSSKQVSGIKTVEVPAQEEAPDAEDIKLTYTGSAALSIEIADASATEPYEYTIVKKDERLDLIKASWVTVSSKSAMNITSKQAPEGSLIYVRKKASGVKGSDEYRIASDHVNVAGSGVLYPSPAKASGLKTLVSTVGVCTADNADGALSFTLYSPTSTKVSSISFKTKGGEAAGSVTFKSESSENRDALGADDKYIITTKITSTENITGHTGELLYASITLMNGDEIKTDETSGIALFLYKKSAVSNPSGNKKYTDSFDRIFMSEDPDDESSFKFRVVFGEKYLIDKDTNTATDVPLTVSGLRFAGIALAEGNYSVSYGEEDGARYADVTVNVASFEKDPAIKTRDEYEDLEIGLANGEKIKNAVKIKLISTARLLDTPLAYAITAGSLKETETIKTTNQDGTVTEVTSDVISIALSIEIFDPGYGVTVSNVTWDGISVYDSATVSAGKATVYLSNKKLNRLTSPSSTTNNLVISFSNGFVIGTGCKLTVVKGE